MNATERNLIAGLFDRLRQSQGAYRDPEAERFIDDEVARQPHAPYAMAQTLIVQTQALEAAQARIADLERQLREGAAAVDPDAPSPWGTRAREAMGAPRLSQRPPYGSGEPYGVPASQPYGAPPSRGGGFLSGALQTAAGVAGGALLFQGLSSLFGGDDAKAGDASEAARLSDAPPPTEVSGEGGWFDGLLDPGGANDNPADDPNSDGEGGGWL